MYSVIVIDDSSLMRQMLTEMINQIPDFKVVASACDAFDAREKIKQYEPDMVTVDINMPKMDGVVFLQNLMRLHPMPAIVISTENARRNEAFDDGAIGFVAKQAAGESQQVFFDRLKDTLMQYTFLLDRYHAKKPPAKRVSSEPTQIEVERKVHPDEFLPSRPSLLPGKKIIAIGSSTGGVEALMKIFSLLTPNRPPIVIAQHIPYGFSGSFAQRLGTVGAIAAGEAKDGETLVAGRAYVAPGNAHLIVEQAGSNYIARVKDGVRVSRHKPSVDILFRSVNNAAGSGALGIILTGMGDDGMIGMKDMFNSNAKTIAQNEASCTVFGMPKRAIENGGVKLVMNLEEIAEAINAF